MQLIYEVKKEDSGKPLSQILKTKMEVSRKLVTRLKVTNGIFLNGESVFVNKIVEEGNVVTLTIDVDELAENIIPQEMPLNILYEDDYMIAINKPANTVIHPTSLHPDRTLANWLMAYYIKSGIKSKIRPVSRLDRNTTGVVIFAKNDYVQDYLIKQMKKGAFEKRYLAVTHGNWESTEGTIDLPIARKPDSIMLRHISPDGDRSITHYKVLETFVDYSLVEFVLETGRTHQIRVHCQALNHPLAGDDLYSFLGEHLIDSDPIIKRQALHSCKTAFIHPKTCKRIEFEAPLPEDFRNLLTQLSNEL